MNPAPRRLSPLRWFAGFSVCAGAIALLAWGAGAAGRAGARDLLLFTLVVGCACQFVPIPIIPLFLWIGRSWNPFVVALVGSAATAVANLHDYYILTALLSFERVDRARDTGWYRRAAEWFGKHPFWTLAASNVVVLPVDVPRLLAISTRYSRLRFVLATLIGRYPRYLLLAGLGYEFKPTNRQILAVLALLAAIWGAKALHRRCAVRDESGNDPPQGEER